MMSSETIADIVREMRMQGGDDGYPLDIKRYADRIEAAAKHTCEYAIPNYGCAHENRYLEENARLRAALKPVLEVNPNSAANGHDWAMMNINAVREAKRIYNESEVKE